MFNVSVGVLCVIIFFCRIVDVSMATFRTVCTVKGKTVYAVLIGFVEVLIWFFIVKEALNTPSTSVWIAFAYAGGYAMGTLIGGILSKSLIKTNVCVQIITQEGNKPLIKAIRDNGFGSTSVTGYGKSSNDKKYIIYVETDNRNVKRLKNIIHENDDKAFVMINESKAVVNGFFSNKVK